MTARPERFICLLLVDEEAEERNVFVIGSPLEKKREIGNGSSVYSSSSACAVLFLLRLRVGSPHIPKPVCLITLTLPNLIRISTWISQSHHDTEK